MVSGIAKFIPASLLVPFLIYLAALVLSGIINESKCSKRLQNGVSSLSLIGGLIIAVLYIFKGSWIPAAAIVVLYFWVPNALGAITLAATGKAKQVTGFRWAATVLLFAAAAFAVWKGYLQLF